jgi:hypothetical protein
MELGEASRAKQGFSVEALTADKAKGLADRAHAAEAAAASERSPGMRAAYEAEQRRIDQARAARLPAAAAASTPSDDRFKALVGELTKAGASLALAQETAARLLAGDQKPVQIEVINATGGQVEAHLRGEQ